MKKLKTLLTMLLLIALSLTLVVACKKTDPETDGIEPPEKKIILSASEVSLNVYDDYVLTYTTENLTGDAVWASDKENIVTVKDGVITARAEGNANVTVTIGETSAVCKVSVSASVYSPTLSVGEKEVNLYTTGEYKIPVSVSYKNKPEKAVYTFSSNTESVATVTADGKVKAVADGEAVITVTADFKGKILTDNLIVKVKTVLSGALMKDGVAVAGETITIEVTDSAEISVQTLINGVANNEVEVSWSTKDDLITLTPSGKMVTVNASKVGSATLTLTLQKGTMESEIQIPISVSKKHITMKSDLALDLSLGSNCRMVLPDVIDATKVISVNAGNATMQASDAIEAENSVKFDASSLTTGTVELTVESDDLILILTDVTAATMVIDDKADLDAFGAAMMGGKQTVKGTYYVLGADVDYEGADWIYSNAPATEFGGTFDGRGYAIRNYVCTRGFFAKVTSSAIVRNLALTGVTINGDYQGSGLCIYLYGTVENCAVVADVLKRADGTPVSGIATYVYANAKVNNCFTKIYHRAANTAFNAIAASNEGTISNSYAVSATSPAMYPDNTSGLYKTDAAFFANVNSLPEANGWSKYWRVVDGELFMGKNKVIEKGISDKTAKVYYDFDLSLDVTDYTINITNIDAALTSNSDITNVIFANGSPIPFTKSGNDSIVIAKSFATTRLGEKEVVIITAAAKYRIVLCFATNVLNNKSEFNAYFSANEGDITGYFTYVVLKSDIDLDGATWAYGDNLNSIFRGTFDGRGHKVENFNCKRGLFMKLNQYSIVRNLLVKTTINGDYGGAGIVFYNYGIVENCAVVMEVLKRTDKTGIAGVAGWTYNSGEVQVRNCIAKIFYRDNLSTFNAIVGTQQNESLAANCYAVSAVSPAMWGSSTDGLYRTDAEFFANVNSLPEANGWSNYWRVGDGELFMGENKVIEKGITDKTASVYYDFDLSLGVTDYTINITNIDAALTTNEAIVSVKYAGGISIPFTKSGTDSIVIPATAVSDRIGEREIIIETSTAKYMIVVCIASQVIHDKAQLNAYFDANVGKTSAYFTYVVLADNIDYGNETWTYADNADSVFIGRFDGRGHTISNITFNNAFFGTIHTYGKVMNLNLSGVTVSDDSYNGSNIAKTNNGAIENCNVR